MARAPGCPVPPGRALKQPVIEGVHGASWPGHRDIPAGLPDPGAVLGGAEHRRVVLGRVRLAVTGPDLVLALPSWVSLAAYLGAFALLLLWGILPVLLLAVGFDYVRASRPLGWRWRAAWAGVAAAGAALEVLPFAFPFSFMSVTPNLHEFAESLGFAAAGAAMILMLLGPREPGPSQEPDPARTAPG